MHCARCVNFVYDDQPKTIERWMSTYSFSMEWERDRPIYFDPIFQEDVFDGDPFPKIVFSNELHVSAFLYNSLGRLLLLNNKPTSLEDQPQEAADKTLHILLRKICGAASSHLESVPILLISTLGISYSKCL